MNGDVLSMDDLDEKTIGAFDFFPPNFKLQNDSEIDSSDSQGDKTPESKESLLEQIKKDFDEGVGNIDTELEQQDNESGSHKESTNVIDRFADDGFDDGTIGVFDTPSYIQNAKNYIGNQALEEQNSDSFDKTVEIFGSGLNGVNDEKRIDSSNQQKTTDSIQNKTKNDYMQVYDALSPKEGVSNKESQSRTKVKSKNKGKTVFLVLAILFLLFTIVAIAVFFPLAVAFAILDIICFIIFFVLKNKSKK